MAPSTPGRPVLLLDAASMWFRAFHALPASIRAPDGRPTGAVHGFLDACARLIADRRPRGLVACLDLDWRPAFRVALLPGYKAHRVAAEGGEIVPPELVDQIPLILDLLAAAGLAATGLPGYEADDVIATLAPRLVPVEIVTGDRDLFQLARPGVTLLYTVERGRLYTAADVAARFAIPEGTYADFAILRGDPSDGLPGVPGVGAKSAAALLARFGGIPAIRAAASGADDAGFPAGSRARILSADDYLAAAETVVRLRDDLPLPAVEAELPTAPADGPGLVELADRNGLGGPVGRLAKALGWVAD